MRSSESDFGHVYESHVWHVYGFFAYRVSSRELAEDLTQGTFERALRNWAKFDRRKASERTWLLAIARNLLIDHHRRKQPVLTAEIDERQMPSVDGPEAAFDSWPELTAVLAQLGDREREILALRFGADLSGPEIATLMDLSLANVQQIISRSLRRLRTELDGSSISVRA